MEASTNLMPVAELRVSALPSSSRRSFSICISACRACANHARGEPSTSSPPQPTMDASSASTASRARCRCASLCSLTSKSAGVSVICAAPGRSCSRREPERRRMFLRLIAICSMSLARCALRSQIAAASYLQGGEEARREAGRQRA